MDTPETKLTLETCNGAFSPAPSITFHNANREVFRITHDGHMITGEGLSTEEATQEAAKLLIASFEEQIQKMVDVRIAAMQNENRYFETCAELAAMTSRAEIAEASAKLWEADALRYAIGNSEYWKARAKKAEADTARMDWLLDHGAQTYHSYSNPLGGGISVKYHKDRNAIDAAMKEVGK